MRQLTVLLVFSLFVIFTGSPVSAQTISFEKVVQAEATVSTGPNQITLTWPAFAGASAMTIDRKILGAGS